MLLILMRHAEADDVQGRTSVAGGSLLRVPAPATLGRPARHRMPGATKSGLRRYPDDDLRPLSSSGKKTQRAMTRALKRMKIKPGRILTSPRLRARQTAEITAKGLGLAKMVSEDAALGDRYSLKAALTLLMRCKPGETVLCVGHEPDLSELAKALLGADFSIKFNKSAVMGIEFNRHASRGAGTLLYFYRPQDLLRLSLKNL